MLNNKEKHKEIIKKILLDINKNSNDFVLKGGTALFLCYNLDRFSTDIDLDSKRDLDSYLTAFCEKENYELFIKKNTDTTKRYTIHYNNDNENILKIEISHRNKENLYDKVKIDGITTYSIDNLFSMKLSALSGRTKIRDLYDICFIYNNFKDKLSNTNIILLDNNLSQKPADYFEYLIKTQGDDEFIDNEKFEDSYLKMICDLSGKNIDNKLDVDVIKDNTNNEVIKENKDILINNENDIKNVKTNDDGGIVCQ